MTGFEKQQLHVFDKPTEILSGAQAVKEIVLAWDYGIFPHPTPGQKLLSLAKQINTYRDLWLKFYLLVKSLTTLAE